MSTRKAWSRAELLVALNIYHKLRFGQFHRNNPVIIDLAKKLTRTPSSVSMKLCNFASLDPALKMREIKGLQGASNRDREVWEEYHANIPEMAEKGEALLHTLFASDHASAIEIIPTKGISPIKASPNLPTESQAVQKRRLRQNYFREIVLNNFDGKCGISGLPVRELLVASHILPWATHPQERLSVDNGLCLSRLHDAAFDQGLISFDKSLCLQVSSHLKKFLPQAAIEQNFSAYEGQKLCLPAEATTPNETYLAHHRRNIFRK